MRGGLLVEGGGGWEELEVAGGGAFWVEVLVEVVGAVCFRRLSRWGRSGGGCRGEVLVGLISSLCSGDRCDVLP